MGRRVKRRCYIGQDGYCHIPLAQGGEVICDSDMLPFVSQYNWQLNNGKRGYPQSRIDGRLQYLHRIILPDFKAVDHIDHNPLNALRSNIRGCTHAENSYNRRVTVQTMSGYKGVEPTRTAFSAYINKGGERIRLGLYKTAEDAARIYDIKSRELFGEFADPNFSRSAIVNGETEGQFISRIKNTKKKITISKSGFKGVDGPSKNNSYTAYICIKEKKYHLGSFKDPKEAAKRYDEEALKIHGPNTDLNFPEELVEVEDLGF